MPTLTLPERTQRHAVFAIFYGVILLVWLTTENASMIVVSGLGFGTALGIVGLSILHWWGGRTFAIKVWLPSLVLLGMVIGIGSIGATFFLMMFKNVQHSHVSADYPWEMVTEIWTLTPAWIVAGGLLGAAIGLGIVARGGSIGKPVQSEIVADGQVEHLT